MSQEPDFYDRHAHQWRGDDQPPYRGEEVRPEELEISQSPDDEPLEGTISPPPSPQLPDTRHLCHHGCDCWQRGFARYIELTPERSAEEIDNQEAHALLVARNRATRDLRRHHDFMVSSNRRVIAAFGELEDALDAVRSLTRSGVLESAARRHAEEHERDEGGPPLWLRIAQWPVIIGAGAFDTWYFMQIFQEISLQNSRSSRLETMLSALPGVGLTAGLIIAGYLLGPPVHRVLRAHEETGREEAQRERKGARRLLISLRSWALRLLLPLLLVPVVGAWGMVRALDVGRETPLLPPGLVALLLMLLAVCAIAVKVAAYDPRGKARAEAQRALWGAKLRLHWHRRRAHRCLTACRAEWSALRSLRDSLVGRVKARYGEAYEFMTYARSLHRKAGPLPPPFSPGGDQESEGPTLDGRLAREFAAIGQPVPEWDALREVQRVIHKYDPQPLADELKELLDQASRQLAGAGAP